MRDVAVLSFAQAPNVRRTDAIPVEMLMPVIDEALSGAGIPREEIGFWCHGSCDYMAGQPFSFVAAVDAIGAWPPVSESHVEMDGAWAFYEAWVKILTGEVDSALVFANGRSSAGELRRIMSLQLDPYSVAPLWPDSISLAALQARLLLEGDGWSERDFAEVVARSLRDAASNPNAQVSGEHSAEELLEEPYLADPLRRHDCPPVSDGVAAVVLAADDLARDVGDRPAWIRGLDHRIDPQALGVRDLTACPSAASAAERAGAGDDKLDVAELHAPFSHQELILREAMGIDGGVAVNPSGGALGANPMMAAGLIRIGEAADRVRRGAADRALAHATSGPCLQQNLVCVLEGE